MPHVKAAEHSGDTGKGRSGYASPLIKARRHRILTETRKIISEKGVASVAIEDVANRAGVAKRTVYNAFQSKERLIAAAIQQYFDEYAVRLTFETNDATIDRVIEHLAAIARRSPTIRNYTRALMSIYYTREVDPEIQLAIYDIAAASHRPWIYQLQRKRQLQPWVNTEELVRSIVAFRCSIAFSWSERRISDDEFILSLIRGVLLFVAGASRGKTRSEIERRLATLESNPFITGEKDIPA